jgi:CoA:oxalate CoA-transferase
MALRCDVLVENFRPGVMRKLGLDYPALAGEHARLVYCSISGFGQTGPEAGRSAYAPILHAASGYDLAFQAYQDDAQLPPKTGICVADVLGGALAFGAIQAALIARERTGRGDLVDLSLLDAMFSMLVYECQEAQFPAGRRRPLYEPVRARDGFVIVAPVSQSNFESMARAAGHPEWIEDPRFKGPSEREHHWSDLMQLLQAWAGSRTAAECERVMLGQGVACSQYHSVRDAMQRPQAASRGTFQAIEDAAGRFLVPNPAFRYGALRAEARSGVPALGQQGEAILRELLGWDDAAIGRLRASGALVMQAPQHDIQRRSAT